MSTIAYGVAPAAERAKPKRRNLLLRMLDAIAAARMKAAEREIARLSPYLSKEMQAAARKATERSELPFIRW